MIIGSLLDVKQLRDVHDVNLSETNDLGFGEGGNRKLNSFDGQETKRINQAVQ